jgi:hypothetical protein
MNNHYFENLLLDAIFTSFDKLMRKGDWECLDTIIEGIEIDKYSLEILIGVLSITNAGKSKLKCRAEFYNKVVQKCVNPEILKGLG